MRGRTIGIAFFLLSLLLLVLAGGATALPLIGDGRDGVVTISSANVVVNNYTTTTAGLTAGALNLTLSSCTQFPTGSDIIIMDMSGTNRARWEQHLKVSINGSCFVTFQNKDNITYTTSSTVQVIRVPNYENLTITGAGSITAAVASQSGHTGGVVAFRVHNTLNTTGSISTTSTGFALGTKVASCSVPGKQGTYYDAAGIASISRNGTGGGGGGATSNARCDGAGGAGQGTDGGGTNGLCTGTAGQEGQGGLASTIANISTFAYVGIGGGGGGGGVCGADGDSRDGAAGSGAVIIYANTSINLNINTKGGQAQTTTNGGGSGGEGGSGSIYLDIYNVTFTSVDASGLSVGGAHGTGGAGIIGGHFNTTSGTTNPTLTNYGAFIASQGLTSASFTINQSITQSWNISFTVQANASNSTDCNASTFSTNDTNFPINSTTGLINLTANFSRANKTYSVLVNMNDTCGFNTTSTATWAFTYHAPVLNSISITPSPTGTTSDLTCNLSITNQDNTSTSTFYKWYKNNTENVTLQNNSVVNKGNLTLGDSWICSASINDGLTTIPWTNSTTLVLGDSTPPVINSFTQSNGAPPVNTGQDTFTVNATDNQGIGSVKLQLSSNSFPSTNYTMTGVGGNLYTYTFTPALTEMYTAIAYAIDGSNNVNQSTNLTFTPVAAGGGGGGGGGGSSTIVNNIVQGGSNYTLESSIIDQYLYLSKFSEDPTTFTVPLSVSKVTSTCTATAPLQCTVSPDGTSVILNYKENDHDFLSKIVTSSITSVDAQGEIATSSVNFHVYNFAYSVLGATDGPTLPSPLDSFNYVFRVVNRAYAGIRLAFLIIISLLMVFIIQWQLKRGAYR